MLTKFLVRNDVLQIWIFAFISISLSSKKECQLFESDWVLALCHNFSNELNVVHLLSDSHCIWVSLEFSVDIKCRPERMLHLFSISGVVRAAEKVVAYTLKIVRVCKVIQGA